MNKAEISLSLPDDWHLHLRDGDALRSVLPDTARRFGRAIIMPNLNPPITTTVQAQEYRHRILEALPAKSSFEPLMTLYLTEATAPEEISRAKASGIIHAVKYYPAGATTHSAQGVHELRKCYAVFEAMQDHDIPLLLHGEETDPTVDAFDREAVFIERHLVPLLKDFPGLRVVLEHITTSAAVEFVTDSSNKLAATITAHHLLLNRNAMFAGGIRPHYYCLPLLKRESHRLALVSAATSGNPKFFLGTDSAPHPRHAKESDCGCAGIYTSHAALELYAEVFESAGALHRLEAFASFYGADFYGLPRNTGRLNMVREPWIVPREISLGEKTVVPFRAGESVSWKLAESIAG